MRSTQRGSTPQGVQFAYYARLFLRKALFAMCSLTRGARQYMQGKTRSSAVLFGLLPLLTAHPAMAYNFEPDKWEMLASSPMCKKVYSGKPAARSLNLPSQSQAEKMLIWSIGAWHYCGGAIRLRRAEGMQDGDAKEYLLNQALGDINYSYSRIDKTHFWAAEMGTEFARAFKGLRNYDKAIEQIEVVLAFHPEYRPALTMYGLIYYDQEKYTLARKYFLKAQGDSDDAQLSYFLGLTAFKLGDYEEARKYSTEAKSRGYPLKGLENMLARVDTTGS